MILVGEKESEKLEIIKAFIEDEEFSRSYASKTIKVNNKNVKLNLHDTVTEARYITEFKNFSSIKASVILLVYDITNKETFNQLKTKWYPEVKEYFPHAIKVLVANNIENFGMQKVTDEEAKKFAKEIKAHFYIVSTKEKYGVDELFEGVAKIFYSSKATLSDGKKQKGSANKSKSNEKGQSELELKKKDAKCCCLIA